MQISKRTFCMLLCLLLALSSLTFIPTVSAADTSETSGTTGDCVWTLDGTELTISGSGAMADYQWNAPWGEKITKAIILDGVTNIGKTAFQHCTELTSISIPESVTIIDDHALDYCISLESLTIPKKVTSIGYDAFYGCKSLESVMIPASVTSIDATAFSCCSGLKSFYVDNDNPVYDSRDNCNALIKTADNALISGFCVTKIPNSVVSIGEFAFNVCSGLTDITIPDSVTEIGEMAFYSCSDLKSVTIGKGIKAIGKQVFCFCNSLSSVDLSDGLTEIGAGTFKYCVSLSDINIPDSVTTIRSSAFYGCRSLTNVTVPIGVTTIEIAAFYQCENLNTVIIPSNVKTIGDQAFGFYYNYGTQENTDLVIYGYTGTEAQRYANDNGFTFAHPSNAPQGSVIPAGKYYLTGSFNGWNHPDAKYIFSSNPSGDGAEEYKLTVSLKAGEEFKVISEAGVWYPKGSGNNCKVTKDGVYDIYFRPNFDGRSSWFNNVIYASRISDLPTTDPTTPSENTDLILGDANGDGVVSVLDATAIQRYMAKLSVQDEERVELCGDVNGGGVSILDATAIQRYLAKLTAPEGIGEPIA